MSVIDFFKKRASKAKPAQNLMNLGMVALPSSTSVPWTRIADTLRNEFPLYPAHPSLDADTSDSARDTQAAVIKVEGATIMFGYMPMPIPWSDLDWPVKTAWYWREAESALRNHSAHLIVASSAAPDEGNMIDVTIRLTQALAAAARATDAAGIYYGNAGLVLDPKEYFEQATAVTPDALPIPLWLGIHPVNDGRGLSAYTTGMEVFGLLNLEAHDTNFPPATLLGRLAQFAHYQIENNLQLEDGETIGGSAEEKLQIRHRKSRYGTHQNTCQIEF